MRNFQDFDTTPCAETCVQVGAENYEDLSRLEAGMMIQMIRRHAKPVPLDVSIMIASNAHDFGFYASIRVHYTEDNPKHESFLNRIESLPETWDTDLAYQMDQVKAQLQT